MATVYLAYTTAGTETLRRHVEDRPINLLVAYPLLEQFEKDRKYFNLQKWVMDSGAFSVWNSGGTIDVKEYCKACKDVDACEVASLDDIMSWEQSKKNAQDMWDLGVEEAIPVFHYEEPTEYLDWCCKHADKIALGARIKTRPKWLKACFGRIWRKFGPKKVHGFGMASATATKNFPFDSVDASSWGTAPGRFGQFCGFTGKQIHLKSRMKKGGLQDLWVEVVEHFKRQDYSEAVWKKELSKMIDRSEDMVYPGMFGGKLWENGK